MVEIKGMKIAAHIGVKDEAELIERCIAHLRRIGVSQFLVCEMYSTDGSAEIVERHRSADFRIFKISNREPAEEWLRRNEEAAKRCEADWLIFADPDEFPLPTGGSLPDLLEGCDADLISVPRYNVPLGPHGPMFPESLAPDRYRDVDLIVKPVPNIRESLRNNPALPWIRAMPAPKIIVRPGCIGHLKDGMHDIVPPPGKSLKRSVASDLVIAHLPLTTRERFARKIDNIREVFARHDDYMGPDIGWHWRRWLELADRGEIGAEFERSVFSGEMLADLRRQGVIRNAAEILDRDRQQT